MQRLFRTSLVLKIYYKKSKTKIQNKPNAIVNFKSLVPILKIIVAFHFLMLASLASIGATFYRGKLPVRIISGQ